MIPNWAFSARARLRRTLSFATYVGLVPPPVLFRPFGITALTIARNEEDWIDLSVRSIAAFVDEVLLVDNKSVDETANKMKSLSEQFPGKVRLLSTEEEDFVAVNNHGIQQSRFRWVLRWHADFIARTSGGQAVRNLISRVRRLDPLRYYCIPLSGVALDGDLEHQFPDRRDSFEPFLFTYSPWLHFQPRGQWESLHVPWFYEKDYWPEAYYFHMRTVKSARRMIQRLYWSRWFEARNQNGRESLGEYIQRHAPNDFRCDTVDEAAKRYVMKEFRGCVPFAQEECGEYPELLLPFLHNPPFTLVYKDGQLVNRIESGSSRKTGSSQS